MACGVLAVFAGAMHLTVSTNPLGAEESEKARRAGVLGGQRVAQGCASLVLDRQRSTTTRGPCPADFVAVVSQPGVAARGDLEVARRSGKSTSTASDRR